MRAGMLPPRAWAHEFKEHQRRLRGTKPSVDTEQPWAPTYHIAVVPTAPATSRPVSARSARPASASSHSAASRAPSSRPQSAKAPPSEATSTRSPKRAAAAAAAETPVMDELTDDQRRACEAFIADVLSTTDTKTCKRILEHMFSCAEERRLLQGYDGPFPSLAVRSGQT